MALRFEHDAPGRPIRSIDPRTGATTTAFVAGTRPFSTVTAPAGVTQATSTYESAGRIASGRDALNKNADTSYTRCNPRRAEKSG